LPLVPRPGLGVYQVGDGNAAGGEGSQSGHLIADAAGTNERELGMRPNMGDQLGVGVRREHDHVGGIHEAELVGLLAKPLGGDSVALSEAHLVSQDHLVEVDEPAPG